MKIRKKKSRFVPIVCRHYVATATGFALEFSVVFPKGDREKSRNLCLTFPYVEDETEETGKTLITRAHFWVDGDPASWNKLIERVTRNLSDYRARHPNRNYTYSSVEQFHKANEVVQTAIEKHNA